ncbi:MAG TPA: EAL domain-containing protein [Methylotenera sp.]|nr:EAL domain-containing protein [Methylotenera sp.]HPH06073.1 EAL domain-containing protein [Methylotenera sp.]HPN00920.1 EAL domain-containing protein [Methylotenera sp.]
MVITGTFLKSKVSQRIAILLFLAAAIPAMLVSGLTHRNMGRLIHEYEHQSEIDLSKNYGLSTFSNLLFARSMLQHFTTAHANEAQNAEQLWQLIATKSYEIPIFKSLVQVGVDGQMTAKYGDANQIAEFLNHPMVMPAQTSVREQRMQLLVLAPKNLSHAPLISLVMPTNHANTTWLVAELNPVYVWRNKDEYPSDIKVCAYRNAANTKLTLFCSSDEASPNKTQQANSNTAGSWELFLNAEFNDEPWTFETTRLTPSASSGLWDFYGDNGYIWIAVLSLLIIGLLSLSQIRRTMIPLEHLIAGTRKISKGQFEAVQVDDKSEFSELASAFNHMSSDIKRQLNTLQVLADVDKKMVAKLDVDHLVKQIIQRILQLKPHTYVQVFRIAESTETEAHGLVNFAYAGIESHFPLSIPLIEISALTEQSMGQFSELDANLVYQHEIAKLGAQYLWVLPIFWQGNICALLTVGSKSVFNADDSDWSEIRDLSNRIGIAISAQKREEQLLIQAHHDQLTGLPNRILLDDRLQQAIEHSQRTKLPTWVVFLDLDRFKYINDSMGHHLGDQVLIEVSKRLQSAIRESDTVARFGGDEFIIVLQGHSNEALVMGVLQRIIEFVAQPLTINQLELNMTCSVGVAVYPNDGDTVGTLIQHADIAMYRAKELGKNNFQFFTEALNKKVADRIYMENLLRHALDKNELVLHYQPKVNLQTMQVVGMEALIRWQSQELGFVSPVQFIHIAEETGLIVPIGEWVIKTACAQATAWQKAGYGNLLMSVNLSMRQFGQSNLLDSIKNILSETGLQAHYLEIELTESMVMSELGASLKILHEIKALGVKISIDDFGTGYSSLSYLKQLPLDTLKIDKSFVDDVVMHNNNVPIVQTIIALAKNLNLKIVAEGVESQEQVLYLQAHACDEMQGYFFSRPKPANEITPLLHNT